MPLVIEFSKFDTISVGAHIMFQGWKVGSNYVLTDPAIHCTELVRSGPNVGAQFGNTNLGQEGMNQFFATHECNSVCRALHLPRNKVMDAALAD